MIDFYRDEKFCMLFAFLCTCKQTVRATDFINKLILNTDTVNTLTVRFKLKLFQNFRRYHDNKITRFALYGVRHIDTYIIYKLSDCNMSVSK